MKKKPAQTPSADVKQQEKEKRKAALAEKPFWKKHNIKWDFSRAGQAFVQLSMNQSKEETDL